MAVLAATVAAAALSLDTAGIKVVGVVPSGWPEVGVPDVASDMAALLLPAVGIAIVAFSYNVLTARAFASRSGLKSTRTPKCAPSAWRTWVSA